MPAYKHDSSSSDDEGSVVLLEPGRTFENLSATTALAGKHIQWSTATKDKILIFCARKGIAAGALDADAVAGLMQEIGFDAKDVQVYEALLKKLLGFIKNNINVKNLDPFLEVTKVGAANETQAVCIVRYARCAADWTDKTDILKNLDRTSILQRLGAHDSLDMGPPVRRAWLSPALCIEHVMARRKSTSFTTNTRSARAATVRSDREIDALKSFLAALSAGLHCDLSNLSHRMISSPELFAKSIVSWAAAGADAKDLEDANLALKKEVGILERSLRDANSRIEAMKLQEIEQRQAATEKARHELEDAYSASPHQEHSRNPVHPQRRLDNSFFLGNANPADDGQGPEYTYRAFPQQETSRSPSRSQRRGDKSSFFEYANPTNNEDNATPRTFVNPRLHQAFVEDDEAPEIPFQTRRSKGRNATIPSPTLESFKPGFRGSKSQPGDIGSGGEDEESSPAVLAPPRPARSRRPATRSQARGGEVKFVDF